MENELRQYLISSDVVLHPASVAAEATAVEEARCYGVGGFSERERAQL